MAASNESPMKGRQVRLVASTPCRNANSEAQSDKILSVKQFCFPSQECKNTNKIPQSTGKTNVKLITAQEYLITKDVEEKYDRKKKMNEIDLPKNADINDQIGYMYVNQNYDISQRSTVNVILNHVASDGELPRGRINNTYTVQSTTSMETCATSNDNVNVLFVAKKSMASSPMNSQFQVLSQLRRNSPFSHQYEVQLTEKTCKIVDELNESVIFAATDIDSTQSEGSLCSFRILQPKVGVNRRLNCEQSAIFQMSSSTNSVFDRLMRREDPKRLVKTPHRLSASSLPSAYDLFSPLCYSTTTDLLKLPSVLQQIPLGLSQERQQENSWYQQRLLSQRQKQIREQLRQIQSLQREYLFLQQQGSRQFQLLPQEQRQQFEKIHHKKRLMPIKRANHYPHLNIGGSHLRNIMRKLTTLSISPKEKHHPQQQGIFVDAKSINMGPRLYPDAVDYNDLRVQRLLQTYCEDNPAFDTKKEPSVVSGSITEVDNLDSNKRDLALKTTEKLELTEVVRWNKPNAKNNDEDDFNSNISWAYRAHLSFPSKWTVDPLPQVPLARYGRKYKSSTRNIIRKVRPVECFEKRKQGPAQQFKLISCSISFAKKTAIERSQYLGEPSSKISSQKISRIPVQCPSTNCRHPVFVSDFTKHMIVDHSLTAIERIASHQCKSFFIDPRLIQHRVQCTHMLYLIRDKISDLGSGEYKDFLPMMVMSTRFTTSDLIKLKMKKQAKNLAKATTTDGNVAALMGSTNREYLMIWLLGIVPSGYRINVTLAVWRNQQKSGSNRACHVCYSGPMRSLWESQNFIDIYHSGQVVLLNTSQLCLLTNGGRDMMQLQVLVD